MVDLYEFNRQRPLSSNSKSRPQMLSPGAIAQNQTVTAAAASGANVGTNAAPVRRFWPSYIDQHVAQLDFDASVMMMTSAGDECQNDDDEEDDDEEDEDGGDEDGVEQHGGGRPQQRRQIGSGMARGGGGAEETAQDGNIFDSSSNSSSMMMAMMALDAAGVAAATAAAADSAQLISTDSLDMEQLRVRCECTKHNANYKLTFDEDSGQWTTSGIGGSFTTTATASPPVAQQQKQQHQRRLKQLLAMNTTATAMNNNNNNSHEEEEDRDGHGDERQHQQQLYTAIMDNNGTLGLQLLEQLNNADEDDDDQVNDTSAYSAGVFNATAEKRNGVRRRPATSVGHGTTTTATDGWRKNSFMDALLNNNNNPNHNANTSSSASSTFHGNNFHGDTTATTKGGGGMGMMTTWGRLHRQGDDMGGGQQPPFNSEKVHSLPELNSNKQPQQRGGGGIGTDLSSVDGATINTITTFAKGASTPAMATYQQQQPQQQHQRVQAVHGSVSSSSSSTGPRRPTSSSLLDNFIATQRQQQQQQRNVGPQMVDYDYSETYLGNGRYIDMNENEIGYVPSSTASIQRSGGDPHHQQLALFDLDLRRRQLLLGVGGSKDSDNSNDDDGGPLVGAVAATTANDAQPQQQRHLMRTMMMKMNTNSNNMATETAPLGYKLGNGNQPQHNANANQQRQQQRRQSHHQMGATKTKVAEAMAMPTTATMQQQQRRTFADLSASRTVPDLKFIALAHNVPTICPPSSVSLDNLLCRVRNSATAADGNGGIGGANAAAIDELIDCCASSMRILSEPDGGGASDGPDSGLGSSHSDGPSHIEDWSSLSVLLPRNVLEACSFFKTNSFLLTGSSNNIEGRRPAVPPPRSFTSATLWRLKEKGNCCLRHWGGANTDPSTPTTPTINDAALCGCSSSSCCCCCTSFGTIAGLPAAAAHGEQCTKSAVFARQQMSSRSRAVLSQKLRLHARELALIGLPVYDQKRAIIERVVEGVAELIRGASSVVLMKALERLLGDELLPGVRMWHVICTVTGPGPVTRNVYQLIQQLEASEKPDHSRVGHFFRGLLSLHSLDGWLSYVVLKEHVLRPFYAPSAFLIGAQTAYRSLYCRLIECVELLSVLNQCGEAGKRWERRQRQQQRVANTTAVDSDAARVGVVAANDAHPLDQRQAQQQMPMTTTAPCSGGAARLPKDSRVPKSSSVPTKLVAAAASTKLSTDCIEEEEQEVEAVHCQQQQDEAERQQKQHNGIKLEDVKLVEVQQRRKEEGKTFENERPNSMADDHNDSNSNNNVQSRDTDDDAVVGAADTVVHAVLRPSRIPILGTRSRSSIMYSDGSSPIIATQQRHSPTTLFHRSSSARPTPSLSPVYICPVREAITGEHEDQQSASLPHGSAAGGGTLLYPLRKGERVRVLAVRGEYTRCSRLPDAAPVVEHLQQQQRLALQNGLVPTRTLQFGANNGTTALNDERMMETVTD
ncbi:hypothetical protein niasHS_014284 [Heterodera schachtii]|uniref:RUN domain-containing protein n=1 Tax=Heterodera schachtii TaxID=97005 RepID=A0ABD2I2V6_HETSC